MTTKKSQRHLRDKSEALIALAAQKSEPVEQPPSPEELTDFFANSRRFSKQRQDQILAYLDSNPQAYARWIKQGGKATKQQRSASYSFLMTPYAIAIYVLLLVLGIGLFWRGQTFKLKQAIDSAYQMAAFNDDSEDFRRTMKSLTDTLQQSERPLSFSQSEQSSDLAHAFMLGLQYDFTTLDQKSSDNMQLANVQQEDFQLGRWHTLLWVISQQNKTLPSDFWQEQLSILDYLQTHYSRRVQETNTAEIRSIVLQLERMQAVLQQLANDNQSLKSYQQLAQVLTALRYGLIPLF